MVRIVLPDIGSFMLVSRTHARFLYVFEQLRWHGRIHGDGFGKSLAPIHLSAAALFGGALHLSVHSGQLQTRSAGLFTETG